MKSKRYKTWGIILIVTGLIMLLSFLVLTFLYDHDAVGLVGGGLPAIGAGVNLLRTARKNKQ